MTLPPPGQEGKAFTAGDYPLSLLWGLFSLGSKSGTSRACRKWVDRTTLVMHLAQGRGRSEEVMQMRGFKLTVRWSAGSLSITLEPY